MPHKGATRDAPATPHVAAGHTDDLHTNAGRLDSSPPRTAEASPPDHPDCGPAPHPSPGFSADPLFPNTSAPGSPDPLAWGDLLSSPIANCLRIGWAPTAPTSGVLAALLDSPAPDIGRLFALVTARDSAVAFRHWHTPTSPPSPWFHPGPMDGIIADYVMKARAASGHRSPKKHGTLDMDNPADAAALLQHCRAVGLTPDPPPTGSADDEASSPRHPAAHLLPDDLIRLQDPALAYSCFRTTGFPTGGTSPPHMGLCHFDSRLESTWDFTWADL